MWPSFTEPNQQKRIADALERIATALEAMAFFDKALGE